jgi:hypothetical protein
MIVPSAGRVTVRRLALPHQPITDSSMQSNVQTFHVENLPVVGTQKSKNKAAFY